MTIGWPHRLDQHGIEFVPVAAYQNVRLTFAIVDLHLKRLTGILCGPLWLLRASRSREGPEAARTCRYPGDQRMRKIAPFRSLVAISGDGL